MAVVVWPKKKGKITNSRRISFHLASIGRERCAKGVEAERHEFCRDWVNVKTWTIRENEESKASRDPQCLGGRSANILTD